MPGAHSGHFWFRTFWGCFLISLVGLGKGQFIEGVVLGRTRQQWDGVFPALEGITFVYALTSMILMTVCSWLSENSPLCAIQMPVQIVMASIYSTIILGLYIAYIGAKHGTKSSPEGLEVIYDLCPMLEIEEDRISQSRILDEGDALRLHDAIKVLREKISYSLPRCGSVTYSTSYTAISTSLRNLLDTIKTIDPREPSMKDTINQTTERVLALSKEIGVLSKNRRPS